jgi:hypothetical protein
MLKETVACIYMAQEWVTNAERIDSRVWTIKAALRAASKYSLENGEQSYWTIMLATTLSCNRRR